MWTRSFPRGAGEGRDGGVPNPTRQTASFTRVLDVKLLRANDITG